MKWYCPPCKSKKSINRENTNVNTDLRQRSARINNKSLEHGYQPRNNKTHIKNGYNNRSDKNRSYKNSHSAIDMLGAKNLSKPEKSTNPLPKGRNSEPVFCLCRRANDGTFMIGCDFCDEWYHPHCLKISNERALELGNKTWSCPKCIIRNQKWKQ